MKFAPRLLPVVVAFLGLVSLPSAQDSVITITPPSTFMSEVTIAVNPANPRELVAGANLNNVFHSTDGGASWTPYGTISSSFGVWGDPCVVFDDAGYAYYAHLSYGQRPEGHWIDRIVVQRSTDGGATWDDGVGIGYRDSIRQQDKEWLAVDLTPSPYHGSVYMSWTEFDKYGTGDTAKHSRILFSRSTDHGATWSEPFALSTLEGNCLDGDSTDEGAVPAVGPDGALLVAWCDARGIVCRRSTDGGATFAPEVFVAAQPGGWDFNVSGLQRANGLPSVAWDASAGAHRGTAYVMWSDQRNGADNTDVWMARSTDAGAHWSPAARVNTDASRRQQFFPSMALDPVTGHVYVVFYDRRNTNGDATEVWMARSTDGGASFTNVRVDDSAFVPSVDNFLGDYIGITAYNGTAWPVWTRQDSVIQYVTTAIVHDSATTFVVERPRAIPLVPALSPSTPDPARGVATFTLFLPASERATLTVTDVAGHRAISSINRVVSVGRSAASVPCGALPAGTYVLTLQTPTGTASRTFRVVK